MFRSNWFNANMGKPNSLSAMQTLLNFIKPSGNIFYVDSTHAVASDGNTGTDRELPMATLDAAVALCTANNGDQIHVMAGHTEAVIAAAGLDFDVAGIEIIGYGTGTTRPTITLGTDTAATVEIGAVNVTMHNLRFVSDINDLAIMLDVNFGNFAAHDCEFVSSSAKEVFCFVDIATTKDDFLFDGCRFYQPSDPAGTNDAVNTGCFYFVDSENITIKNCEIQGFFETSIFHNKSTAATEFWVIDCWGSQLDAGVADVGDILAATTGGMVRCSWMVPAAADVAEASFITIAASCTWGMHHTTFMNDGAGGNRAIEAAAAT